MVDLLLKDDRIYRLPLPRVTVVIADCIDFKRARRTLQHCVNLCSFGEAKFFTHFEKPDDPYVVPIEKLDSVHKYSDFMIKKMVNYIKTDFVLTIQHDGFVVNTSRWTDEFLNYDYIGAPWHQSQLKYRDNLDYRVGNGGFSLQSRRFLEFLRDDPKFDNCYPAGDAIICQKYRPYLEEHGFKFAPVDLAHKFSCENYIWNGAFGQHAYFMLHPLR